MLHDDIDTDLLNASMYTPPLSKETMPATSSTEGTIGNKMSKDPRTVFLGNNKYIYIRSTPLLQYTYATSNGRQWRLSSINLSRPRFSTFLYFPRSTITRIIPTGILLHFRHCFTPLLRVVLTKMVFYYSLHLSRWKKEEEKEKEVEERERHRAIKKIGRFKLFKTYVYRKCMERA